MTTMCNPANEIEDKLKKAGRLCFMASTIKNPMNKQVLNDLLEELVRQIIEPALEHYGMGLVQPTELVFKFMEYGHKLLDYAEKAGAEEKKEYCMHLDHVDHEALGS